MALPDIWLALLNSKAKGDTNKRQKCSQSLGSKVCEKFHKGLATFRITLSYRLRSPQTPLRTVPPVAALLAIHSPAAATESCPFRR